MIRHNLPGAPAPRRPARSHHASVWSVWSVVQPYSASGAHRF